MNRIDILVYKHGCPLQDALKMSHHCRDSEAAEIVRLMGINLAHAGDRLKKRSMENNQNADDEVDK